MAWKLRRAPYVAQKAGGEEIKHSKGHCSEDTEEVRGVAGLGNKEGSWEVTKYSVLAARKQRGFMAIRQAT